MATNKYYSESELVQKKQDGEFGWLDYVNYHSKEWQNEFADFCRERGLSVGDESAEKFVDYKGEELEKALADGDA
jgi:hypothetical protein